MTHRILKLLVVLIVMSFITGCASKPSDITINMDELEIQLRSNNQLIKINTSHTTLYGVDIQEEKVGFERSQSTIDLVTRKLPNGDLIFYYAMNLVNNEKRSVTIRIPFSADEIINLKSYEIVEPFSAVTGQEETTLPTAYLTSSSQSSLVSKVIYSNTLTKTYSSGFSTLRELWGEAEVELDQETITVQLKPNATHAEGWIIMAQGKLFEGNELQEYIDWVQRTNENTWYTAQGHYAKIAWSIDPFTRKGYGRSPGTNLGSNELKRYSSSGRRIDYVLLYQKLLGLEKLPRNDDGMVLTEYTSTYVQKNSGITAPFVDSRFNEQISEFYEMMLNRFDLTELLPRIDDFATYVVHQIESGVINSLGNDHFLPPDYFGDSPHTPPLLAHSSLNHSLGIANRLITTYLTTGRSEFRDYGLAIINTIEYQGTMWLNEAGDTFYRMTPSGQFDSTDYKEVTLVDLLMAQQNLLKLGMNQSEVLGELIRSKVAFLTSVGYNLPSSIQNQMSQLGY
jgi:hypothetical protein